VLKKELSSESGYPTLRGSRYFFCLCLKLQTCNKHCSEIHTRIDTLSVNYLYGIDSKAVLEMASSDTLHGTFLLSVIAIAYQIPVSTVNVIKKVTRYMLIMLLKNQQIDVDLTTTGISNHCQS
jgi:hypothetical protein